MSAYRTVIGLEIHIALSTASKMFSVAPNNPFASQPNEQVTPLCLGMPGTLPVPNRLAIEKTVLLGLALGATIPPESKFDRKHYFYPDLPKGYQISQYDQPLCQGGELTVGETTVRLRRIHLEEDAGKLLHTNDGSRVDLNRAGVPLVEIVTEPDFDSPAAARSFLKELQAIARQLDISEADMEKGMLRCDANINVEFELNGRRVTSAIAEIKNLNSFRAVERACQYETERLYRAWSDDPDAPRTKLTVGWNEARGETTVQRNKEGAADYRYFPEPDIPPLRLYDSDGGDPPPAGTEGVFDVAVIRQRLTALPGTERQQLMAAGVSERDAATVIGSWRRPLAHDLFKLGLADDPAVQKIALALLINEARSGNTARHLLETARLRREGAISSDVATRLLRELAAQPEQSATALVDSRGWQQATANTELKPIIAAVVKDHPEAVTAYRSGKTQAIGKLIGEVMTRTDRRANPERVRALLIDNLNA